MGSYMDISIQHKEGSQKLILLKALRYPLFSTFYCVSLIKICYVIVLIICVCVWRRGCFNIKLSNFV